MWVALLGRRGDVLQSFLALVVPVALCALLQWWLSGPLFGLLGVAFAVCVLWFAWGPRDLGQDIEAVLKAPDSERRRAAAQALRPEGEEAALPWQAAALVEASFRSALQRWFGVLFWFLLAGPAGALAYRLAQVLAWGALLDGEQAAAGRDFARRLARLLDWAPAHLMALAMAVASDFDAVFHSWRAHHDAAGKATSPWILASSAPSPAPASMPTWWPATAMPRMWTIRWSSSTTRATCWCAC